MSNVVITTDSDFTDPKVLIAYYLLPREEVTPEIYSAYRRAILGKWLNRCSYCSGGHPVVDNGLIRLFVSDTGDASVFCSYGKNGQSRKSLGDFKMNFCPKCGKKLEEV